MRRGSRQQVVEADPCAPEAHPCLPAGRRLWRRLDLDLSRFAVQERTGSRDSFAQDDVCFGGIEADSTTAPSLGSRQAIGHQCVCWANVILLHSKINRSRKTEVFLTAPRETLPSNPSLALHSDEASVNIDSPLQWHWRTPDCLWILTRGLRGRLSEGDATLRRSDPDQKPFGTTLCQKGSVGRVKKTVYVR
jgi:hypothetical protein